MNLSHAFLVEIFAIFHRRYLHFFVIFKKIFVKKYVLKGKEKMASSRSPPNKKNISLTMHDSLKHASRAFFIFTERIKL